MKKDKIKNLIEFALFYYIKKLIHRLYIDLKLIFMVII